MMLKIKEMYRNPPFHEHRIVCFLIGACLAATGSVLLIFAGEAGYALLLIPSVIGFSQVFANHTKKRRMRLGGTCVAACAAANVLVLAVFIILFG